MSLINSSTTPMSAEQLARYDAWAGPSKPKAVQPLALDSSDPTAWRWGWNCWIGIHYGPVPVGVFIVILFLVLSHA
jgi:hypothetical protein